VKPQHGILGRKVGEMSGQMPEEARTHRFIGVAAPQEAHLKRSAAEAVRPYRPILARPTDLLPLRRIRRRRLEDRPYPIKHRLCHGRREGRGPASAGTQRQIVTFRGVRRANVKIRVKIRNATSQWVFQPNRETRSSGYSIVMDSTGAARGSGASAG